MSETADRLTTWIRAVDLEPGATRLDVVQGAAASLAGSISEHEILDLVLLAHGIAHGKAVTSVAAALREHDETSVVNEGDLLGTLTAAVAAAFALEREPDVAVPFGLGIGSASFLDLQPAVPELGELATAGLVRASEILRQRAKLPAPGTDIGAALQGWEELPPGQPVASDQLITARAAVEKATKAAAGVAPRMLPPIQRRFDALEEELDLLWWAFGEFSELADTPFKSLSEHVAGCVAGIELASHTTQRAPLPSGRAILSRILHSDAAKATDLERAVPASVTAIGGKWVEARPDGHPLLPVLSSLQEYESLGQQPVWKEAVAARLEIDPERRTTVLDLAEQVTREILLTRAAE